MHQFNIPHTYFKEASKNKPGCYFCDPCKGSIVQESENFIVLLDTFPIKQGHLMICSKKHYGCAGEIPNEWMLELLSLKGNLRKKVEELEGNAIFYEHGRAGCCMSSNPDGSKCNHFHLHCLPADISLLDSLKDKFDNYKLSDYTEITQKFCEEGHYLYFEDPSGEMNFFPASDESVESHLLRTMICNKLSLADRANWENCNDAQPYIQNYIWAKKIWNFEYAS
jgi:diadenosine tetraphosphate (Ap4A) HIT family hydrolase